MAGMFHHEELYRDRGQVSRLGEVAITFCGAGALGSNLADNLVRQGVRRLRVIDKDRVEEHNVGTQIYGEGDVGAWKCDVLKNRIYRNVGVEIDVFNKELTQRTVSKFLKGAEVVIDTFDNSASRQLVQTHARERSVACLHAGLFADYGEVVWDDQYRVPGDSGLDVCDYPLARNLVLLTVAVAAESLVRYILDGTCSNYTLTLRDLTVRELETVQPAERGRSS